MQYDPFSPEVLADPGSASHWLLTESPAHHFDGVEPPFTLSNGIEGITCVAVDFVSHRDLGDVDLLYRADRE